jgi:NADPH2:quinone reductase
MRAVVAEAFGPAEVLHLVDVDTPEPESSQVLVVVEATAVNQVDIATRMGLLHDAGLHGSPPVRFGWDVCGRVDAVGTDVRRVRVGQRVIGLSDRLSATSKTHAEAVVLDEDAVSAVPNDLDPDVCATLPLAGLTAMQALDQLNLSPGQSVLVTGAGGAVGSLAVQLACLNGLNVIGSGRASDEDLVRGFGADVFIEAGPGVSDAVREITSSGVDGALDTAGLINLSLDAVRSGGSHVSLAVLDRPAPLRRVRSESIAVAASWKQLTVLASLAHTGNIRVSIAKVLELEDVQKSHELVAAGGLHGRVVLRP